MFGQPDPNALSTMMNPAPQQTPPKTPEEQAGLEGKWEKFFRDPKVMAFLGQTALNLFSPRAPGQTGLGHMAAALGSGGEATARVAQNQERTAQRELDNKNKEREISTRERANEINAEQNTISRAQIGSNEKIAQERNASAERVAKLGYDQAMATTNAEIASRERIGNKDLLSSIVKGEYDRYKTAMENYIPQDGVPPPQAPAMSDILKTYQIMEAAMSNRGRLRDGDVTDDEVLAKLRSADEAVKAQGYAAFQFLDPKQVTRIIEKYQKDPNPPAAPGAGATPQAPGAPSPQAAASPAPGAPKPNESYDEAMARILKENDGKPVGENIGRAEPPGENVPVQESPDAKASREAKAKKKADEKAKLLRLKRDKQITNAQYSELLKKLNEQ